MFERFTEPARRVVELALDESDRLGHGYLGAEHVLAGIAAHGGGPAARVLREAGLDAPAVLAGLDQLVSQGVLPHPQHGAAGLLGSLGVDVAAVRRAAEETFGRPAVDEAARRVSRRPWWRGRGPGWTPLCGKALAAKQAFYLASVAADALGHASVGPEHLLLGVLGDAEAPARWTRRTHRVAAQLGLPRQPGPHPARVLLSAHGLTIVALREMMLAELRAAST